MTNAFVISTFVPAISFVYFDIPRRPCTASCFPFSTYSPTRSASGPQHSQSIHMVWGSCPFTYSFTASENLASLLP
ncbi:MAG: hypothetical protein SFV17_03725, partial [Candidatus Obscuribacter sp.]|nr:hypothetical protein [Candidatus Obscuribacter sp.]